jgi:hypothetical protein
MYTTIRGLLTFIGSLEYYYSSLDYVRTVISLLPSKFSVRVCELDELFSYNLHSEIFKFIYECNYWLLVSESEALSSMNFT